MSGRNLGVFILLVLSHSCAITQAADHPSVFLSGNIGAFVSSVQGFNRIFNLRIAFAYGGSLGIPLSSRLCLLAKYVNVSKSGITASTTVDYLYGRHLTEPATILSTVNLRQWLLTCGVSFRVSPSHGIGCEVQGGLTYAKFSWGSELPGSFAPDSPVRGHDAVGCSAGIVLEHQFAKSPLSTFVDCQYNYLWPIGSPHVDSYGAISISTGIRVYLPIPSPKD